MLVSFLPFASAKLTFVVSALFLSCRAKVESRNNLETYLYNLKTSYEDTLKDKMPADDAEELKTAVEDGLEVSTNGRACRNGR